jgi:hypothetical protein
MFNKRVNIRRNSMSNLELHENNIEAAFLILKEQIKVNKELLEYLKVNQSEHISNWRLEKVKSKNK